MHPLRRLLHRTTTGNCASQEYSDRLLRNNPTSFNLLQKHSSDGPRGPCVRHEEVRDVGCQPAPPCGAALAQ